MAGTSFSLTLPMRPIPPRITSPVSRAVTAPTASRSQPNAASRAVAMEFACTISPPPMEAQTQKREKASARPRSPRPFSI